MELQHPKQRQEERAPRISGTPPPKKAGRGRRLQRLTSRRFPHPGAAVWAALTTPELLARWWAPGDIAPVVGHRFTLDMGSWGQQQCEVLTADPGKAITFLFSEGNLDTTVTWRLESAGDGTALHHEHAGFRLDTPMGKQAIEGMGNGWPGLLARIDGVLAGVS